MDGEAHGEAGTGRQHLKFPLTFGSPAERAARRDAELIALAMAPERHDSGGGIGSVIDFPAERGEPQELPKDPNFTHSDETDSDEPGWNAVDEHALPRLAFAEMGEDGNRTTWGYPHHFVKGATAKDNMGAYSDGKMFLHKGQLEKMLGHADMMHLESPARDHLEAHAKATGMRLPWVDSFNDAAAQSAAADPDAIALAAGRDGQQVKVDREKGVIRNVVLMTKGKARPAGTAGIDPDDFGVDDTTLAQLCEGINCAAEGVKSHLTHVHLEATPGTLKDGIMRLAGRVKNARVIGDSVRGDVHLHAAGANSPTGNLREYLLTLAEEDPSSIGCPPCSHPTKRPAGAMARSASHR